MNGATRRRGFTVLELLVVVGIIVILMSFLLPVIGKVRNAAMITDTNALIRQIQGACERYYQDYRAYPGPFSNDAVELKTATVTPGSPSTPSNSIIGNTGNSLNSVTMSENLTLGLFGGLTWSGTSGSIQYSVTAVGLGPTNFSVLDRSNKGNYMDFRAEQMSKGAFVDDGLVAAADTNVPEFIDRFTPALPILYLRARKQAYGVVQVGGFDVTVSGSGATATASLVPPGSITYPYTNAKFQYDQRQIRPYVRNTIGGRYHNLQGFSTGAGLSSNANKYPDVPADPDGNTFALSPNIQNAIIQAAPAAYLSASQSTDAPMANAPFNLLGFFRSPQSPPNDPTKPSATGYPRERDRFMLISAGPDGVYGSDDDIVSFGFGAP